MEIDGDVDRYGSTMILSELPPDPEDAIREVVGAFTDSVEMNWLECLETEDISSVDDIDQSQEMNLLINLNGVVEPQEVVEGLDGLVLGTYETTVQLSDASKATLTVEVSLSLEDMDEEEAEFIDDLDETSEHPTHVVAKFRADFSIE